MSLEAVSTALAGRYTVEREIGSGGMATVYLAFDVRHDRRVAVKVLRQDLAAALGTERFLREIKIAASLSHPNIIPLFDSGEAGGLLYYVMPLVEGESLRARLNREKQLPLGDAIEIASQVGEALSYAHSHGVVHRDIKPDNVLLSSGQAVVADFGLARVLHAAGGSALTATGLSLGTPAYMSPEQAAGSDEVDARADQYALACTLFEMLAGEPPFTGRTVQAILARQLTESAPNLAAMRDGVPQGVADAVRRALSKTPADRYPTVTQFASAYRGPTSSGDPAERPVGRRRPFRRARRWAVGGASLAALITIGVLLGGSSAVPFDERDWILITDFQNQTGDSVFDGTLDRALAVGLQQSRYLNVFPRSRVAETLAYMGRPDSLPLDEALGREVALRRRVRVVVTPAISRLGTQYVLTTNVVDPESGDVLVSRSAEAERRDGVLRALDRLAGRLRRDLGESVFARLRRNVGLDQATTTSLEALRAWTAGNRQWDRGDLDAAGALYQRAVELDSTFAMAYLDLALYNYWHLNDRDRADVLLEKARQLASRVTDRERLIIEARSAGLQGDPARAVRTYNVLLADYPDDAVSWSNLGFELLRSARWDEAADAYHRAIALDSLDANAAVNLATVLGGGGRHEEAVTGYRRAFTLNPRYETFPSLIHEYGFNLVAIGRYDEAEEAFRGLLTEDRETRGRGHRALAAMRMHRGQYDEAIEHLERAVLLDETGSQATTALRNRMYLAAALLTRRGAEAARAALRPARGIIDSSYIAPAFLATLGRLYTRVGEVDTARAVLNLLGTRANEENDEDRAARAFLAGEIALAEGNVDSALAYFERAAILPTQPNYAYLGALATTQALAGRREAARATLERIVAGWSDGRESQEPWVLAHYHLARLHDDAGDSSRAIEMYDAFLDIWDRADDGLAPVAEARRRLAGLTQEDRGPQ